MKEATTPNRIELQSTILVELKTVGAAPGHLKPLVTKPCGRQKSVADARHILDTSEGNHHTLASHDNMATQNAVPNAQC